MELSQEHYETLVDGGCPVECECHRQWDIPDCKRTRGSLIFQSLLNMILFAKGESDVRLNLENLRVLDCQDAVLDVTC